MNCCDDNGKCTCGAGERPTAAPAAAPTACDQSAICKALTPRCAGCTSGLQPTGEGILFAPGEIEAYRPGFFGSQAQRRELKRWLLPALAFTLTVALCALAAGVIAGRWL